MEDIVPIEITMQDIAPIKREPYYEYSPHNYITVIPVDYSRAQDAANVTVPLRQAEEARLADCDTPHRHPSGYRSPLPEHIPHQPSINRTLQPCYPSNSFITWSDTSQAENKRQVCVFLMNKVGLCIDVDRSMHVTAQELLDVIFEDDQEVGLPSKARDIFSLWMTSPLIELQLKPSQRPFWIHQEWVEILIKYTSASQRQINMDEPVLSFQRNVFFDKREEMRIDDMKIMELLYEESKGNILDGRYPCEAEDCEVLAGIQARLELGPYDVEVHTPEYFRTKLQEYLPPHACRTGWSFFGLGSKTGPEHRIVAKYESIPSNTTTYKLLRKYLEFCWSLPYYGCAFFQGQVEKPVKGMSALLSHHDKPVLIGINREGLHVIFHGESTVLLSLHYHEFSWDYAAPFNPKNSDCLPCIFVQFNSSSERSESKLLQIFSRQSLLIDNLINTFVSELKKQTPWTDEQVDHLAAVCPQEDDVFPTSTAKLCSDAALAKNMKRLSLATFNDSGVCIEKSGSWSFMR